MRYAANPAPYSKHIKATTIEQAKNMSYNQAQYLPGVNNRALEYNYYKRPQNRGGSDLFFKLGDNDIDLRGTYTGYREALEMAFKKTGYSKEQFEVSKWARDVNGKSIPVEYIGPNG